MLEEGKNAQMTECVDNKNHLSTGYVKKRKSFCENGKRLDKSDNQFACGEAATLSGVAWFFIIVSCIAATAGVTWFFMNYKRFIHNGRIR